MTYLIVCVQLHSENNQPLEWGHRCALIGNESSVQYAFHLSRFWRVFFLTPCSRTMLKFTHHPVHINGLASRLTPLSRQWLYVFSAVNSVRKETSGRRPWVCIFEQTSSGFQFTPVPYGENIFYIPQPHTFWRLLSSGTYTHHFIQELQKGRPSYQLPASTVTAVSFHSCSLLRIFLSVWYLKMNRPFEQPQLRLQIPGPGCDGRDSGYEESAR